MRIPPPPPKSCCGVWKLKYHSWCCFYIKKMVMKCKMGKKVFRQRACFRFAKIFEHPVELYFSSWGTSKKETKDEHVRKRKGTGRRRVFLQTGKWRRKRRRRPITQTDDVSVTPLMTQHRYSLFCTSSTVEPAQEEKVGSRQSFSFIRDTHIVETSARAENVEYFPQYVPT